MTIEDIFRLGQEPETDWEYANLRGNDGRGMTHEEFDLAVAAEHEGTATGLANCYICSPEANPMGPIDYSLPLRGVLKTRSQPAHFPDPSIILTLSCGHEVL